MDTLSDEALIEKFIAGSTEAFNFLVWRWQKKIYSFVYRYVQDTDDAKDITQMTFIRVFKNIRKLRDRTKFRSWLYQIEANISKDELKKRNRRDFTSVDEEWENENGRKMVHNELLTTGANQDREMDSKDLENIIKYALKQIPEEQRIVIILKEYQHLKFTEIAEILKMPVNTIKSRMYYGLKNMKEILLKNNIDEEVLLNGT